MIYLRVVIGLLFALNIALVIYFFNKFEKMFIIMKAWSLKDLVAYNRDMKNLQNDLDDREDDDDLMP